MPFNIPRAFRRREDIASSSGGLVEAAIGPSLPRKSERKQRFGPPISFSLDESETTLQCSALPRAVEMRPLPKPVRQVSCANPLDIINDWRFWGGFPRAGQLPMPFGFNVPPADDPSGFIPGERAFEYIVTKFPTMPLHEQHLLVCYAGMPTTLAALQPRIIPKAPARKCPGILILEFDGVLTKNSTIEPGGGYGSVNGYIQQLMRAQDSCGENIKDLATAADQPDKKFIVGTDRSILWGTLEDLLNKDAQIIIVSKNYDVELVLLHLMHEKLFGSVMRTKPSLLHNIHLVVYPMCRKDFFDTDTNPTSLYVGYAMRCLDPAILPASIVSINYYSFHSSRETDRAASELGVELGRYIKMPNRQDCEIRIHAVQPGPQFLASGANGAKISGRTNSAASCWQPQNYQLTQWKNVCCPKCRARLQVVRVAEKLRCETCKLLLLSHQEETILVKQAQGLLSEFTQGSSQSPGRFRDSGAFESPGLAMVESPSADIAVKECELSSLELFQSLKRYLAYRIKKDQNIFSHPYNLTIDMIEDEKTAIRCCPLEHCLYQDNPTNRFCIEHGGTLWRFSIDRYFSSVVMVQNRARKYLERQAQKDERLKRNQIVFDRYQLLCRQGEIRNQLLIPGTFAINQFGQGKKYTLTNLLSMQQSSRAIQIAFYQCMRVAEFIIMYIYHGDIYRALMKLEYLHQYLRSVELGFELAICPNPDCCHMISRVCGDSYVKIQEDGGCILCNYALTILQSRPPWPIAFSHIPPLSPIQQKVEQLLAKSFKIFDEIQAVSLLEAPSVESQVLFTFSELNSDSSLNQHVEKLNEILEKFAGSLKEKTEKSRDINAQLTKQPPREDSASLRVESQQLDKEIRDLAADIERKEPGLKALVDSKANLESYIGLRELICEFELLKYFNWRHSSLLPKMATPQPVAAVLANRMAEANAVRDEALSYRGIKIVRIADADYSKLIISPDMDLRYQQRINAYFGAPLMPVSFEQLALPPRINEVAVCVFEFEAFLIKPIFAPCNVAGSILNINPERNIQRDPMRFLLEYKKNYPETLIAIICQTWDLALVERYLNVMQPGLAERCIIITNPGSANGSPYLPEDPMRQLQYLYQALWTRRQWIRDLALVHRSNSISRDFLSSFVVKISNLAPYLCDICQPNKIIWVTHPEVKGGMPQKGGEGYADVFYYKTAVIGTDPGWTPVKFG